MVEVVKEKEKEKEEEEEEEEEEEVETEEGIYWRHTSGWLVIG